ncbi:hypothetical protein C4553_02770 [Candidatus Parcubacteria bacterium]|nr:MAG: hypothetical protein C4553_02770 [Candidatus Parcubacteria bacterium]
MQKPYDLIIIGGSAAATAAGIYAARRKLNFKIITKEFGGEVATSGEIDNYPGVPDTDGIALSGAFRKHLEKYGAEIEEGVEVADISKKGDLFCISAKKDGQPKAAADKLKKGMEDGKKCDYEAKAIIVTTGVHPRELNVPGEKEFRGKGVTYCTTCDGPLFGGKITATIGGGNSALESAIMMSGIASKVYVINKNPGFKGDAVLIDKVTKDPKITVIYEAGTKEITGDKFVTGLKYQDKEGKVQDLKLDGILVHIGMVPNSELVKELEKNDFGEIKVDKFCKTNIPGLFAAGDVTDVPYKQIGVAVGQGITAVLSSIDYINKLSVKQ